MEETVNELRRSIRRWSIGLACCTVVSVILNLWHAMSIEGNPRIIKDACRISVPLCEEAAKLAVEISGVHPILGIIFAIVPPAAAFYLSDAMTESGVGLFIKVVIVSIFGLAMATSIVSQALVMRPYGGGYNAEWSIPVVLDVTALVSLHMMIKLKRALWKLSKEIDDEADRAALREAIEADIRPDMEKTIRRTLEADIAAAVKVKEADIRRTLEADNERTLEADRAALKEVIEADIAPDIERRIKEECEADKNRELEADKAALEEKVESVLRAKLEREIAARIRLELASEKKGSGKAPRGASTAKKASATTSTIAPASKDTLLDLLEQDPDLTVVQQADALGVTDRTVRRWREQLEREGRIEAENSAPVIDIRAAR